MVLLWLNTFFAFVLDSKEPLREALVLLSIHLDPRPGAGMEMSSFPADIPEHFQGDFQHIF